MCISIWVHNNGSVFCKHFWKRKIHKRQKTSVKTLNKLYVIHTITLSFYSISEILINKKDCPQANSNDFFFLIDFYQINGIGHEMKRS